MNIQDYCNALNVELKILYYPNQGSRWSADLEGVEIMEDGMLCGANTDGKTPDEAIYKLCINLRGKRIVFNVGNKERRREYYVPEDLGAT